MAKKRARKNFIEQFKLYKASAQKDTFRVALNDVFFKSGYAYAASAHTLVRAKIQDISNFTEDEIALLDGKSINAALLAKVYKHRVVNVEEDGFHAVSPDDAFTWEIVYKFNTSEQTPPNFDKLLSEENPQQVENIGLNTMYLSDVANAIGCSSATKLDFKGHGNAIIVSQIGEPLDIKGIIMPMLTD